MSTPRAGVETFNPIHEEGNTMRHQYTRTETVQAHQWLPGDPIAAGATLGWLLAEGVEFTHTTGPEATLTLTPGSVALVARPGEWVVRRPEGSFAVLSQADFESTHAPAEPLRPRRRGVTNVINGVTAGGSIIQTGDHHGSIHL